MRPGHIRGSAHRVGRDVEAAGQTMRLAAGVASAVLLDVVRGGDGAG